jgi:hypothetical protein
MVIVVPSGCITTVFSLLAGTADAVIVILIATAARAVHFLIIVVFGVSASAEHIWNFVVR